MICCLCGRRVEEGDLVVRITMNRVKTSRLTQEPVLVPTEMEDGSPQKLACPTCPAMAGAPLSLIGADRGYDV